MKKVLLIGNGAREHAIALALAKSKEEVRLFVFASSANPGIKALAADYKVGESKSNTAVVSWATEKSVDFCIVGPEAPLGQGLVDVLLSVGIPSVGPAKDLARIETSKSFARQLFHDYKINGPPEFKGFEDLEALEALLHNQTESLVI